MSQASAYGRSVEDLVGAFSIEKTIKIGSSSEDFLLSSERDPLSPPPSLSGPMGDDQAPSLAGLEIEPQIIQANSTRQVNITLHAIDDQSFYAAEARLTGPGGEEAVAIIPAENITAGSSRDGLYSSSIVLPENIAGIWRLESLILIDRGGNKRALLESGLKERAIPTEIWVV